MTLLDMIFPPRCAGCDRYGAVWCRSCATGLRRMPAGTLGGIPLVATGRLEGPLQRAIHAYKYRPRPQLAAALAEPLGGALLAAGLLLPALSFVPLHPRRLRERGFNQAERLATELSRRLGVPLLRGLARVRATPAQVGLSQAERRVNLQGAFQWTAAQAPPAGLGLVDDVCTTGATLQAAAQAVAESGGSIGAFLVLAVAQTLPAVAVT
ncbi:MAG: ComF family protein [Chloroflexi bacterium]|nr:MAG: ComF family protein [Chloroflexota bacterium]